MSGTDESMDFEPAGTGAYIVAQGDCLNSISEAHGFFWETLWNLEENRELKSRRKDPNVLWPGDKLAIPPLRPKEMEKSTEQRHKFIRKGVPARLVLEFRRGDKPRANESYLLVIDGLFKRGKTDDKGCVRENIPNGAQTARLVFQGATSTEEYELQLGGLDPYNSLSGVRARLVNLGYSVPATDGGMDPDTRQALRRFQRQQGLEDNGELTDETCSKLREAHGS